MESLEHLAIGSLVSVLAVAVLWDTYPATVLAALVCYGVGLSVFVDLDHFVLARLRSGDWAHLRAVLRDPQNAIRGQEWIFADLEDFPRERLLSHALITVVLVSGLWFVDETIAAFTALVLVVHVGCDLLRDAELV